MSEKAVRVKLPKQDEFILNTAKGQTFPLGVLKLRKKDTPEKFLAELELDEKIYNYLTQSYGSDEIILYCTFEAPIPALGAYSPDMQISQGFLEKIGVISNNINWVKEARPFIKKNLSRLGI